MTPCKHILPGLCGCPPGSPRLTELGARTVVAATQPSELPAPAVPEPEPKKKKPRRTAAPTWSPNYRDPETGEYVNRKPKLTPEEILADLLARAEQGDAEAVAMLAPIFEQINGQLARACFAEFFKQAWRVIEPSTELVWNWHLALMCAVLQAVFEDWLRAKKNRKYLNKIRNVIFNVPPGSSKSRIIAVCFQAWCWLHAPGMKFICLSVNDDAMMRDARAARELIRSPWYVGTFKVDWSLKADQDAVSNYGNTAGGERLSMPSKSEIVGLRADCILIDDPNNPKKAENKNERDEVNNLWSTNQANRVNDGMRSLRIGVQQRTHAADWTGNVLELQGVWAPDCGNAKCPNKKSGGGECCNRDGWLHVVVPAEFEAARKFTMPAPLIEVLRDLGLPEEYLVVSDPRAQEGESIDPVRMPLEYLAGERKRWAGTTNYACTPGETPILMGDWTEKCIADVGIGDTVVGFVQGNRNRRARLVEATVTNTLMKEDEVFELEMESGRKVRCTADHRWFVGRGPCPSEPNRKSYVETTPGRTRLCLVAAPLLEEHVERDLWNYLAGIIDGEGTLKQSVVAISQSPEANPETFARIAEVLTRLNISYYQWTGDAPDPKHSRRGQFVLHDSPTVLRKLLQWTALAKREQAKTLLYRRGSCFIKETDRVLSMRSVGKQVVYALETTTGNYVAWGYASSNCQMMQSPVASEGNKVHRGWLNFCRLAGGVRLDLDDLGISGGASHKEDGRRPRPAGCHDGEARVIHQKHYSPEEWDFDWITISLDCASKKTEKGSNYGILVIAGKGGRYFLLEDATQRGALHEIIEVLVGSDDNPERPRESGLVQKWRVDSILIEPKAAGPDVMDTLLEQMARGDIPTVSIWEADPGNADKEMRLEAAVPYIKNGQFYMLDGAPWLEEFVKELTMFPNGLHDDRVDALSQCLNFKRAADEEYPDL